MPNEQIPTDLQARREALHELCLRLVAEINHHVAAEDHVKFPDTGEWFNEIYATKFHHRPYLGPYAVPACPLPFAAQQVFAKPWIQQPIQPIRYVCGCACGIESVGGNI